MSTYILEIDPKSSLVAVTNDVRSEEIGASEFISSSLSFHSGRITNLATFDELPPGTVPKRLHFVVNGTPPPLNTKPHWAGVMIIAGSNTAVAAFREQ